MSAWYSSFEMPLGKQVVVVGRVRHHGQDLACLRVHDDDHAALQVDDVRRPLERLLRLPLDLDVDRQLQRVARHWLLGDLDRAQDAAQSVLLDLLLTVRAAQHILERRLDAGLADLVVIQVARVAELGKVVGRDRAGVAHHVRNEGAVLVLAPLLDIDLDAGEAVALLDDDPRHVARARRSRAGRARSSGSHSGRLPRGCPRQVPGGASRGVPRPRRAR